MPSFPTPRRRAAKSLSLMLGATVLLSACSGSSTGENDPAESHSDSPTGGYPTGHIHGMTLDPETEDVLLATHDGLFNVSDHPVTKIGPPIDLMGFTATGSGEFYASGHPGPGTDMPNPVGLIKSTDGGQTWKILSREGESDFHTLTTSAGNVVAFDGTVRTSEDGQTWQSSPTTIQPFNLAGSPRSDVVLATTEEGVQRSTDSGSSWTNVPGAPVLMFTTFAGAETAVGITPGGQVQVSTDAGLSWASTGSIQGQPAAIAATASTDEDLLVWVTTPENVQVSEDGGKTFAAMVAGK